MFRTLRSAAFTTAAAVLLGTAAAVLVSLDATAQTSSPGGPHNPGGPPSTVPAGGTYTGPGDIVPPFIPAGSGPCLNAGLFSCPPCSCPAQYVTPNNLGPAGCVCDPLGSPMNHLTMGLDITFRNLIDFLNNPTCLPDGLGNVTMCIGPFDDACEVTGFLSPVLLQSADTPLLNTVAVQICVDGQPLQNPTVAPLNEVTKKWSNCLNCSVVQVSVTFNRDCMRDAIAAWITFWQQTIPGWNFSSPTLDQWAIHVGVTKCQSDN